MTKPIDIVFSFDTTGSMYPCLSQVRQKIKETVRELFSDIPFLRIGIIAHGDYCDRHSSYVTKHLSLTNDKDKLVSFVDSVGRTGGGDSPECYELVLHEARTFNWDNDSSKLLVMIGDDIPHPPTKNPTHLDWKEEAKNLASDGISVHGVQCLNRSYATSFYQGLADLTGGVRVSLNQFAEAVETIKAIAFNQYSPEALQKYEEVLVSQKKMTRTLDSVFAALSRRDPKTGRFRKVDARSVDIGRFQVVSVEHDQPIKDLVESIGAEFERGRGFYEFTKREEIQAYKQIILLDKESGDMFEGVAAREVLGLPSEGKIKMTPSFGDKWSVFVQSTSNNRKLIGGTRFLYESK